MSRPATPLAVGNANAAGSPSSARRCSAGPPGKGRPSRRAPLSIASPAASSSVAPRTSYRSWTSTRAEQRVAAGGDQAQERRLERRPGAGSSRRRGPAGGRRREREAARGGQRLGRRDADEQRAGEPGPGRDGDEVGVVERGAGRCSASSTTRCELEAMAGGHLRHHAAVQVVDALRGDDVRARPRRRGSTTAAHVSSQLVSIARSRPECDRTGVGTSSMRPRSVAGRAPHDERVLAVVLVVAAAQPGGSEAEPRTARSRARWTGGPRASAAAPARRSARAALQQARGDAHRAAHRGRRRRS